VTQRKALGRGLAALIPTSVRPASSDYFVCPIEKIQLSKTQPRRYFDEQRLAELAASIREQGVVQPLVVRPVAGGNYMLIAGERRWRAAQSAGLHEVPVVIRSVNDLQAFELALVENLQREDLNPIEEAEAYQRLIAEHGYTQEQLGERLGRDRSTLANSLRLLKLPEAVQQALVAGALSPGHARALLALEKASQQIATLKQVTKAELSVRQTEALVKRLRTPTAPKPAVAPSANLRDVQERISRALKTRVRLITSSRGRGRIEIAFNSLDEFDRLLEILLQ
jgi:ParB family transcriptional regulator, chromosome partitioning protein